jgi:RNA polymerase sigma-70 factor (ECF subfamily)
LLRALRPTNPSLRSLTADQPLHDGSIVDAVLSGDRDRFALLVERYQGPLRRMAENRLGRSDWAEDVVQESFLCAFKSLHTYDSRYSFRTWLWTIVLNQCRRHYQRHARRPSVTSWTECGRSRRPGDAADGCASQEATPPESLLAKERNERLAALLSRLPEEQADALRLRFFGGLKYHEIASAMPCSLSSAKNRVRWGLSKLSDMMRQAERRSAPIAGDPT